jgi:carotenoid cleavage dioxygenase
MTNVRKLRMSEGLSPRQREELAQLDVALDAAAYNRQSAYGRHWGFRSVHDELSEVPVTVRRGRLPADLEGLYIRNGTNPQFDPMGARYQMFDGPGMLHQVRIAGGQAHYSNAYVRAPRFEFERSVGREVFVTMGELLTGGPATLAKMAWLQRQYEAGALPELKFAGTGCGTAIQYHAGSLYAFNEAGYPFKLDTRVDDGRLVVDGSGAPQTWEGRLGGPFSAHPAIDPDNGDMFSVATNRYDGSITIVQVSEDKLVRSLTYQQPPRHMAWIHECCLSANFIIFPDISMRVDREGLRRESGSMYTFDDRYLMRFGILPRNFDESTEIRWVETASPGVIWHFVNAWEEPRPGGGTQLVMYAPKFADYPAHVPIHNPEETHSHLTKWVIDLQSFAMLEERTLLEWGYERNSFNVAFRGKRNRWCYLLDEQRDGYLGRGVLKYDYLDEREVKYVSYDEQYGGEPLFVPRIGAKREDDGYVLDLLMAEHDAELLVLDAASMEEVCRLGLPQRVPFGVHAVWLDPNKLAAL